MKVRGMCAARRGCKVFRDNFDISASQGLSLPTLPLSLLVFAKRPQLPTLAGMGKASLAWRYICPESCSCTTQQCETANTWGPCCCIAVQRIN